MTVQCPRCRTQYKIPTARINDPRPVFKCTRCSLVFSSEPDRGTRGGKAKEDKNLPLPFSSRKEPSRAKPAAVDEDAPTIRSARDAEADEEESELLEEAEEVESEEDETEEEDTDEAEDGDAEEEAESADDEDEAEEEEEEEAPARPARRPRRTRAADEDDAAEPAFARAERERAAERERERIAAEKERAAAEKERERARIAAEKERLAAERERERQRAAAEKEKERERARAAAEKERARAAEARRREREELRLRDEEDEEEEIENEGPDDLGDDDDDEPKRPVLRASESKQRRAPINPRRMRTAAAATPSKSPLKTVTIGVAAVVLAWVLAALWLGSSSEAAIATLSRVPVLGSLLGGDHLLVWRLQLTDVDGGLDQIKGGRPAYVVSGRAVNTSNEDLRVIEIEGRLLVNGVEQRRQTVYAANQQRKTIQDLSPSEVEMLLRLEPNRRFSIRPGESASFLLVFPNPPPGTTEVTCRVLDARNS